MNFKLVEFAQEFMAHLVVLDKQGHSQTLYQVVGKQYNKSLVNNEQGEIRMLPEGKDK